MDPKQIKNWLRESNHDRMWLAGKCHVSKSTVDGWLAGRPISGPAQSIIIALMCDDKPIAPRFTMDQYRAIQNQAAKQGLDVETWIEQTIIRALSLIILALLATHALRSPTDWSVASMQATGTMALHHLCRVLS